ncbi:MAG: CHAT domain-containing protein [Symploca sp. SIO1C4]|uniref:CHAT domain-containing protein n=1 Tax=Symploca sp. SIO1C4 TaxID=2607765 RepID=A0A6B3N0V2_9CYAN|nr:CHAT domain-containing protein [Symploca sp. SIO1C4]
MKLLVSKASLLLALAQLAGSINTMPAQAIVPNPKTTGTNSPVQNQVLLAEATNLPDIGITLDQNKVTEAVPIIEQTWEQQYENYLGFDLANKSMMVGEIADTLNKIAIQTGKKPALLYIVPRPQQLELVLVTPDGIPIHKRVLAANREALLGQVQELRISVSNPAFVNTNRYLAAAQQLYKWMIAPLEADLHAQNIDTLVFCMGAGLRTMPLAALHDGQKFLVEKFSISLIPAFKLTNTVYTNLKNSQVLAMGASKFKDHSSLPAVPAELENITQEPWSGQVFLNQEFTLANLQSQRRQNSYKIIHLATHADFQPGSPSNSYIQFWDNKLRLDQIKQLQWYYPPVELLVLSACRTAIGDPEVELGFAGLAVQARVKSAIASLWYVSDEGTLQLMTQFYQHLKTAPIKAEALRQAQIAMLKSQSSSEGSQLRDLANNFSHPYFWAAFTVVGNPW